MLLLIETSCEGFWAWPWPLILAFLLGAIFGWILKRLFTKDKECDDCSKIQAELDACRKKISMGTVAAATTATAFAAAAPKVDDSVKDDLTKVEGIGPKIKELLNADGIWSFVQLADAKVERIQNILDNAGPRYRVHNPKTWPKQSDMAAKGLWDELKKWQDELDGGL